MTPRNPDDEPEFEEQFDDDVFAAPEPTSKRTPRTRASSPGSSRSSGSRSSSRSKNAGPPPSRARRIVRVVGIGALAIALILFVVSFIAGLGGAPDERVVGDAQQGGERLDAIGPRVRVEVLNASGVAGLARRATEHLRDRGFDVVAFGNAGVSGYASTVVLARTTDTDDARAVAAAMGVDSVEVQTDPQLYLDVTVMLGSDWPPAADAAPEETGFLGWFRSLF